MKTLRRLLVIGFVVIPAWMSLGDEDAETPKAEPVEETVYLGVHVAPIRPDLTAQLSLDPDVGLIVEHIDEDSPAMKAGIQKFDILIRFDGQILINPKQLGVLVRNKNVEDDSTLEFIRKGEKQSINVRLAKKVIEHSAFFFDGLDFRKSTEPFWSFIDEHDNVFSQEKAKEWSERLGRNVGSIIENLEKGGRLPKGSNGQRIRMRSGNVSMNLKDSIGSVEILVEDGDRIVVIRDKAGKVIHKGPANSAAELEQVPNEFREKVKLMRKAEEEVAGPRQEADSSGVE